MLFFLSTPEYKNVQLNTTKVRVHLRNGIAEMFDQHQDLMGKVENDLVEIETNFENKSEKFSFILQEGVFIVSNKGLDNDLNHQGTGIYIYAKKAFEIGSGFSIEELSKQYDETKVKLEKELEKLAEKGTTLVNNAITSKSILIQDDLEFLRKSLIIAKDLKK